MTRTPLSTAPRPVPALAALRPYAPPQHLAPVDLLLSGNEGDHPDPAQLAELQPRATALLRSYPSPKPLEAELAARLRIAPAQVLVTAGGDEAIDRVCRTFLDAGRRAIIPQPTFVMLPHYAKLTGATIDAIPWREGPYPLAAVRAAVRADTALITVVTPNNPSGATATGDDLRALALAAPHALLLVDLAYAEYADHDLTPLALSLPNAVVVRTLSKAWGLAGLRVGYAAGPDELIAPLRAAGGPYSVSGLSLALAQLALQRGDVRRDRHVTAVRRERLELGAVLRELGAHSPPSQGNFALARHRNIDWLRDGLAGLGIAVRIFPGTADLDDAARITCPGDERAFARLCHALRATLQPQALLFDLDGVLADVSGSYRRAIAETAASFGVTVTPADIACIKALGNANNDWDVTWRLISAGGVTAALDEVTARFEALYQGTAARPGLRRHERLLPSRALLERLAARLPLGIVTGRPRGDAERWLRDHDLAALFGAVVCMEDAPLKPDPAPVRAALARLGVERAWLLGDTPDDVRAARDAHVVPIGVVAPGEVPAPAAEILLRAGAARVLTAIDAVEGMLS